MAATYNAHYALQQQVATWLLQYIAPAQRVLEIGCGTGGLSRLLHQKFTPQHMLLTDAEPALLTQLPPHLNACVYNLNAPPPAAVTQQAPYNLIIGNLVLHWCAQPAVTIQQLQQLLAPHGQLWFTAPLPHSTPAWAKRVQRVLPHLCPHSVAPYATLQHTHSIDLHTTPRDYARFLRGTGATGHYSTPLSAATVRGLLHDTRPLHDTFIVGAFRAERWPTA